MIGAVMVDKKTDVLEEILTGSIKMCSCAECGHDLVQMRYAAQLALLSVLTTSKLQPRLVAGRIKGRPYCLQCLRG